MGRRYSVSFNNQTLAANMDLFQVTNATSTVLRLHEVRLGQDGGTSAAQYRVRISRLHASITNGSGGSTATPAPMDSGDSASAATFVGTNNSTQATCTTKTTLAVDDWDALTGWLFTPLPEDRPVIAPGDAIVVENIVGTPTAANGTLVFEEIG